MTYERPEMAHQAKSALTHNPYSIQEGTEALQVEFEGGSETEKAIKRASPEKYLTYPFNHSFQEKYLKVVRF